MCVYCNMGDRIWKHDKPWDWDTIQPLDRIYVPKPKDPTLPDWGLDKLKDYLETLKQIKDLEDKLGCPCEPNKADYIKLFEERIAKLNNENK